MNSIRALKYSAVFILPALALLSFNSTGILTFLPLLYAFVLIPILEQIIGADATNLPKAQLELVKKDRIYDMLLYLIVPVQWACLIIFLFSLQQEGLTSADITGRTTAMGILCGVIGINVAHELGHRTTKSEQILAQLLLASSLYMHFFIEHNKGHHRNVATMQDAATARKNESIYRYFPRTIINSFKSAWEITKKERARKKHAIWSLDNEMIRFMIFQLLLCAAIGFIFSLKILLLFLTAALIGILLLETVNYIEHYGLTRSKINEHRLEDVQHKHSWNSDHIIGRLVLFELTRHSDHHREPSKHYQFLETLNDAPQLPSGYPGMMLLSFFPPIWFRVMNPKIKSDKN